MGAIKRFERVKIWKRELKIVKAKLKSESYRIEI